ncbi:MAG: hypothetical protein EZS28_023714 [Streblomastix strix]|uniref:Cyclin N-terminal domain-containing protein n=1 Tax=Streblomastix strix TaxID=222440 RepID=A0A5J4VEA7_9EUKA|nr:MAG: hypothetical protein EZS28_023714 [Streblomastix strix]
MTYCANQENLEIEISNEILLIQLLAQKFFNILVLAIADDCEEIQYQNIERFLKFLRHKVEMQIEEGIIAAILLQRFISNQTIKGVHVLDKTNVGTVLIVSFMLAMKLRRDVNFKNNFFAKTFNISNVDLNKSECGFLRMIEHQTWVEDSEYFKLFNEIQFVKITTQQSQFSVIFDEIPNSEK